MVCYEPTSQLNMICSTTRVVAKRECKPQPRQAINYTFKFNSTCSLKLHF